MSNGWMWLVGNVPMNDNHYGTITDFDCYGLVGLSYDRPLWAWVLLGGAQQGGHPFGSQPKHAGTVGALFSRAFCEQQGAAKDGSEIDRWFPHDGTTEGIAAAQREAVRYIEMTLTLEL